MLKPVTICLTTASGSEPYKCQAQLQMGFFVQSLKRFCQPLSNIIHPGLCLNFRTCSSSGPLPPRCSIPSTFHLFFFLFLLFPLFSFFFNLSLLPSDHLTQAVPCLHSHTVEGASGHGAESLNTHSVMQILCAIGLLQRELHFTDMTNIFCFRQVREFLMTFSSQ